VTWGDVLDNWELFALDLQDIGIDVWDRALMRARPGVWLRSAISGLLARPPLGYVRVPVDETHERTLPVWPNRVQQKFIAPLYEKRA
jgi:hypothetical protein